MGDEEPRQSVSRKMSDGWLVTSDLGSCFGAGNTVILCRMEYGISCFLFSLEMTRGARIVIESVAQGSFTS